jgi:hypothetical protein
MDSDSYNRALKLIFVLSFILVLMDIGEVYLSYSEMTKAIRLYDTYTFKNCLQYHYITQMFFTSFATFAGLSACIMSFGLLIDYQFFSNKCIDTFFRWNYMIFGPYMFAVCMMGYYNFSDIVYVCDMKDRQKMYMNYSTLFALILCFVISFIITFAAAVIWGYYKFVQSIRYGPEGYRVVGRLFWNYILSRPDDNMNQNAINN